MYSSAKETQIGGGHYKDMAIQPVEYIHKNGLGYLAGNVVKYVTRHKSKGGAEDVRKAIHYCQLILEMEYGEKMEVQGRDFDSGKTYIKQEPRVPGE